MQAEWDKARWEDTKRSESEQVTEMVTVVQEGRNNDDDAAAVDCADVVVVANENRPPTAVVQTFVRLTTKSVTDGNDQPNISAAGCNLIVIRNFQALFKRPSPPSSRSETVSLHHNEVRATVTSKNNGFTSKDT